MSRPRKTAADFGRKVFRILYQTRQSRPALRDRRLKRCRVWARRKALPQDALDYLYKAVSDLFEDMERNGELDWLPLADAARELLLLPPRHRIVTDYEMCRRRHQEQLAREHGEREAARKPVIEAALGLLRSEGLTDQQIGNYQAIITALINVAETTEPGSTARARRVEGVVSGHQQKWISQPLLHRLAELTMSLRDKRARTQLTPS